MIYDNDNVAPEGQNSGILGKARYMAPEVVRGEKMLSKQTDRFSLSVILFLLFYANHPFEGASVLACPCLTEKFEKKFYGPDPIFIYDDQKPENRPVRGVHNNVLKRRDAFPALLRDTFKEEFGEDKLQHPDHRLMERQWQHVIQQLRDMLVVCPKCNEETFVEDVEHIQCMCCGQPFAVSGNLEMLERHEQISQRYACNSPGQKLLTAGDKFNLIQTVRYLIEVIIAYFRIILILRIG